MLREAGDGGTLVQIAQRYGCPTVTIAGGPAVPDPLAF